MSAVTGWYALLGVWTVLLSPTVESPAESIPAPAVVPAQNPVEAARQQRLQRETEFQRKLAWMEGELARTAQESADRDAKMAESTAKYHYVTFRARAIDLNRAATEYVRRATGFRLPNTAERLPVLK